MDPGGHNLRVRDSAKRRVQYFLPRSDLSRFFTLTPLPQVEEIAAKGGNDRALGIGPISFPGYLDRQEIVTRVTQNQIEVSDADRWAEPLEENLPAECNGGVVETLANRDNLARFLGNLMGFTGQELCECLP
jgi:ABC-type transport auxiliary lipoprotein component